MNIYHFDVTGGTAAAIGEVKKMSKLSTLNQSYEEILHSEELTDYQKDKRFSQLMTEMELAFNIPALQNKEYERKNPAVISLYRKISMSRSTV